MKRPQLHTIWSSKDADFWLLDNRDSFVFNLAHRLHEVGASAYVVRSDEVTIEQIDARRPTAIVISPGPGHPINAGVSVDVVRAFSGDIPILGVCLGHQAIGVALGANVLANKAPMHGKSSEVVLEEDPIFAGVQSPTIVGRYHSLEIDALPNTLQSIAHLKSDGKLMAVAHATEPTYGFQFHPESILTPSGTQMLRNFVEISRGFETSSGTSYPKEREY